MNELLTPTKIIRSKRKSIALIIEHNGDFIVRAPIKALDKDIFDFIAKKQRWIQTKRTEQLNNFVKPLTFANNEKVSILGKEYVILLYDKTIVKVADNILYLPLIKTKEKLIKYLKKLALKVIKEELKDIAPVLDVKYESISINSAKTRWGSCSGSNKLHFTYKLMLCPMDVVDYIIIHELCHIKEKNHSKNFWKLVKTYYPDYKQCEKWLKEKWAVIDLI